LPRIIRSTVVNLERARPLAAPLKGRSDMDALTRAAETDKRREMEKIHASAEIIVEEILVKARNDADNMLVDAREETINVLQEAVRDGREQGMAEALREIRALEEAAAKQMDAAVKSLAEERRQMLKDLECDILELVFDIVQKVMDAEMPRSTGWIAEMVKVAMQQMEGDDSVVMKVAAGARQRMAEVSKKMMAAAGKAGRLTIVADSKLPPGGCVIDTGKGVIDTGLESKLDKLKTVLRENA
jgi:flagellar assembly protein FliH